MKLITIKEAAAIYGVHEDTFSQRVISKKIKLRAFDMGAGVNRYFLESEVLRSAAASKEKRKLPGTLLVEDIAKIFGVTPDTVLRWRATGRFPIEPLHRQNKRFGPLKFRREDVIQFIRSKLDNNSTEPANASTASEGICESHGGRDDYGSLQREAGGQSTCGSTSNIGASCS